jgi:hypothetical protein
MKEKGRSFIISLVGLGLLTLFSFASQVPQGSFIFAMTLYESIHPSHSVIIGLSVLGMYIPK